MKLTGADLRSGNADHIFVRHRKRAATALTFEPPITVFFTNHQSRVTSHESRPLTPITNNELRTTNHEQRPLCPRTARTTNNESRFTSHVPRITSSVVRCSLLVVRCLSFALRATNHDFENCANYANAIRNCRPRTSMASAMRGNLDPCPGSSIRRTSFSSTPSRRANSILLTPASRIAT